MERVGETQMLKCAKRREAEALTAGDRGDEDAEQRGWLAKRPYDSPPRSVGHCGGSVNDSAVRAIRGYCRDRGLSADAYTPVAGLCGGGGKFRLADLVDELHRVFAEDRVNVEYVRYLMDSYRSDPAEWLKYAKFSKFRYTRNLVDKGNGKFNLMILCWGEGHGSSIHDHPQSDCVMKILAGQLNEVRFAWPEADQRQQSGDGEQPQLRPMTELSRTVLETDGVCHINDTMGLHRVENASYTDKAVSLHLYCPPFDECSTFNQHTGHETKAKSTFWSIYGEKVSKKRAEELHVPDDN